jgi:hypothetical protein
VTAMAFGPAYPPRIRALGIRNHPTALRSPWQNGYVERLIGEAQLASRSIRRESLDYLIVFDIRRPQALGAIVAIPILGRLYSRRSVGLAFHEGHES